MTLKEIDKKLKRIKKELEQIEITVRKEKGRTKKKKETTFDDWLELRDKVSAEWDKNVSVEEEMKYQREKNW